MKCFPQSSIGVTAMALCSLATSCSEAPPRKYAVLEAAAPERSEDMPLSATLIVEIIDVESTLFEDWLTENTLPADDATSLRKAAQQWVRKGDAMISETVTLRVRNGTSSKIQSQQFEIPTEGDNENGENGEPHPVAPAGISMEASVTIDPGSNECSVQLNRTFTSTDRTTSWPARFGNRRNQKHLKSTVMDSTLSLSDRSYGFLGSHATGRPLPGRKEENAGTSLFFLRADAHSPSPSETLHSKPL